MKHFSATFGIVPGYGHQNKVSTGNPNSEFEQNLDENTAALYVQQAWKKAMDAEEVETGIVVGAVIFPTRTLYPEKFGCPENGEITCTVQGFIHPDTKQRESRWMASVRHIVHEVAKSLQQSTVMVGFWDAEISYYRIDSNDLD